MNDDDLNCRYLLFSYEAKKYEYRDITITNGLSGLYLHDIIISSTYSYNSITYFIGIKQLN